MCFNYQLFIKFSIEIYRNRFQTQGNNNIYQNLTPNRRLGPESSNRRVNGDSVDGRQNNNRYPFRNPSEDPRNDISSTEERVNLSKIQFGKLPYPVGNYQYKDSQ